MQDLAELYMMSTIIPSSQQPVIAGVIQESLVDGWLRVTQDFGI